MTRSIQNKCHAVCRSPEQKQRPRKIITRKGKKSILMKVTVKKKVTASWPQLTQAQQQQSSSSKKTLLKKGGVQQWGHRGADFEVRSLRGLLLCETKRRSFLQAKVSFSFFRKGEFQKCYGVIRSAVFMRCHPSGLLLALNLSYCNKRTSESDI